VLALWLEDFYKVGHIDQYDKDVDQIWANLTPRSSRVIGVDKVVFFGMQYFIKEILIKEWQNQFFNVPLDEILAEYRAVISATLGVKNPRTDHIEYLHKLGYLPIDIYSLPEGSMVPLNVPVLVITNTTSRPSMWLPNYFETIISNILWGGSTSATTAKHYRDIFTKYAKEFGHTDLSFIDWQGHDFSMRGMMGREAAVLSGMGHLTSFSGTDTIPAIIQAHKTYNAPYTCGGSVPATEHSVMCAGSKEGEFETFRRLVEDTYPTGIVSIVSDTWDLWTVLTDYMPRLKETILQRDGKVVIRPDSGDPVKILCGDESRYHETGHSYRGNKLFNHSHPAYYGVFELLRQTFGETDGMLNKVGAIYGDSISPERADAILKHLVSVGLSPYNAVFGIGSYTYQFVTRDTYGWAMKATAVRKGNDVIPIFKSPVTDDGGKFSHKGIPAVYWNGEKHVVQQVTDPELLDQCAFVKTFSNGQLLVDDNLNAIRERIHV